VTDESTLTEPSTGVLETVVDAHGGFVVVLDAEGRLRRWTEEFERVLARDDLAGERLDAVVDGSVETALETVRAGEPATVEVRAGGPTRRYEVRLAPGDDGQVVGLGRLRETPVEERQVAERTTEAVFSLDDEWRVTYANDRAREMLVKAMEAPPGTEVVGRDLWESVPGARETVFYERYHEAMATQEPVTFEATYEPMAVVFEVRAYPSESGLSVYLRDVTERRRQRERTAEREQTLTEIHAITSDTERDFESQVGALIDLGRELLDADHGVLSRVTGEEYRFEVVRSANPEFAAGTRVPLSATVCERTVTEQRRVVLADIVREAPTLADRVGDDGGWEEPINCYVGAPVLVDGEVYGTFCFYDGDVRGESFTEWETTVVDIMAQWVGYELTRRRVTERLRRQNDRLEEFVSVVSHDLRNPLETLSGHLEYAEETGDPEHFEYCRQAVDRMESLIDDLLTLARAGETVGDTEPVDLAVLLQECWELVDGDRAELVVDTDRTVHADRSRLRQLLENLLRNSVEHAGPDVTITVGDTDEGFYVADDGPGIPEEDRERVFEAGFSSETEGTGFGLQIVRQVAEAHGWTIDLVEAAGGGARFEFTL